MDPIQSLNRNALAQYLVMVNQARTPELTVKVIRDALSDKDVYAFGELYAKQQVQDLSKSDGRLWLEILKIFMWGTYADYEREHTVTGT